MIAISILETVAESRIALSHLSFCSDAQGEHTNSVS